MIPENRKISSTEENKADFLDSLNEALDVAEHISDEVPDTAIQEAQETHRADGSSSTRPLDVDDKCSVTVCKWRNYYESANYYVFYHTQPPVCALLQGFLAVLYMHPRDKIVKMEEDFSSSY